jgi:transcriptional regulator GlxA family with amidase domain
MKIHMKTLLRITVYLLAFLVTPVAVGAVGFTSSHDIIMSRVSNALDIVNTDLLPPVYDPNKPTVAVLLGNELTEVTDFLAPYEVFSASQAYNVYAVAPNRRLTTLTGGLDVLPHLSLAELDRLTGKSPDVIVIPHMTNIQSSENKLILEWIRHHAKERTLLFSICTGAGELAATELLNGRTATTHWGDIDRLERKYPKVHWIRGIRYVDQGNIVTSAGVTSGIDAALHILAKFKGSEVARNIARRMHYPSYYLVQAPEIQQNTIQPEDAIYLLNAGYRWNLDNVGVLLYDKVGEIDLASVFDTYAASSTTNTRTVAPMRQVITSKHGLHLVPRTNFKDASALDRLLVPGIEARKLGEHSARIWAESNQGREVVYLHADATTRFAFNPTLEDLARRQDIPTAIFAAKRLEYRASSLHFEGRGWPMLLVLRPFFIGLLSLSVVVAIDRLLIARHNLSPRQ